jgi:uncharacterized protein YfdQ (DUF2303 family)
MGNDYRNTDIHEPARKGDVEAALAAGAAIGNAQSPYADRAAEGTAAYSVVPKGYELKSLEEFLPRPLRIRQDVALQDTDSFIAYVNDFKTLDASRIFFNGEAEEFTAVLDYHDTPDEPSWCGHKADFKPRRSVEFTTWMAKNRVQMTQVDFARFLEENLPDVVEPNSAELLQVALTFEAKRSVEFSSGVRLANGQIQFQFDETIRGAAQKGTIEIPEQFVLGISIHVNGPAYRIPVRLRWRLQESKLTFWYEIVRPHRFIEDALREILLRVATDTGIAVLAGSLTE